MVWSPADYQAERQLPNYLVSLTPQAELALCAFSRAHALDVAERRLEAVQSMRVAYRLSPTNFNGAWVTHLTTKALSPERSFPDLPCDETAGGVALGPRTERPIGHPQLIYEV